MSIPPVNFPAPQTPTVLQPKSFSSKQEKETPVPVEKANDQSEVAALQYQQKIQEDLASAKKLNLAATKTTIKITETTIEDIKAIIGDKSHIIDPDTVLKIAQYLKLDLKLLERLKKEDINDLWAGKERAKVQLLLEELLLPLISIAKTLADPPISKYYVGGVTLGKSGFIYLGCNYEFKGVQLNQAIHCEQTLMTEMRSKGEQEIVAMGLTAAPCGHCRQVMTEISQDFPILIQNEGGYKFSELLPKPFGPKDLGIKGTLFAAQEFEPSKNPDRLIASAIDSARCSYAPYTSPAGVAIATKDGVIFTGEYLESAAYNPSLPPLQAALVNLKADGRAYSEITNVVLAEHGKADISHALATQTLLKKLAPDAQFSVVDLDLPQI